MNIAQFNDKVKNGEIEIKENIHKAIEKVKRINNDYHYFNYICDESSLMGKEYPVGVLSGLPISVKDCICVKDMETTSGSRILEGYKPTFDSTAIKKIKEQGGIIIGKTSQDEFGFGGFSENIGIDFNIPLNPFDKERSCGGSSGGSAGITQMADFSHLSIAESTGGSIVNPASFCGVYGLCPTYGRVSRYGLIDYANSLDKIGIMSKNIEDIALMLEIIAGYDEHDSTSVNLSVERYSDYLGMGIKKIRIGLIAESLGDGTERSVKEQTLNYLNELESLGAYYEEVSLPITMEYGLAVYYLIATAEASTNLAKYCGMRYGRHEELKGDFNEYFSYVRGKNFGLEVKRRIMLGTFARMAGYREAYYIRAAKVRTLIIEEYKKLFKRFDILMSPTMPILPPKISEIKNLSAIQNYMSDTLNVGPNLAGLPHINIPVGFEKGLPIGAMIIADHFQEGKLIQVGAKERYN